jgi:hypothetical protein
VGSSVGVGPDSWAKSTLANSISDNPVAILTLIICNITSLPEMQDELLTLPIDFPFQILYSIAGNTYLIHWSRYYVTYYNR